MEESKKSGGGDVRAEALACDDERDKARKLVFSFISTLAHGGALCAPLTSLASRRKSRFAEKKSATPKKNCGYSLPDRNVYGDSMQTGRDSTSCGLIAFLGVLRTYFMAEVGGYRFVGFVRIWTKTGRFCGPKAK